MKQISVDEFQNELKAHGGDAKYDFINVCTPDEYNTCHIGGTRNVPLDELESHVDELQEKSHIYVQCRSGNRSRMAIEKLQSLGITAELFNIGGGLMAWQEAGKETNSK